MVTPRPSQVGCGWTKSTAPVSCVGRYGLAAGVPGPGPSWTAVVAAPLRCGHVQGHRVVEVQAEDLPRAPAFATAPTGRASRT